MTSEEYLSWSSDQVLQHSPIPLTVLPDAAALLNHLAEAILDEIRQNNQRQKPANPRHLPSRSPWPLSDPCGEVESRASFLARRDDLPNG
ncbi:MAG TPA: hypothetical protein VMW65_10565 [Chloroflexota bacterium]|nr:hypothetical protein [Chloroflexota bacterium]